MTHGHTCHAHGCRKIIAPAMLMCLPHWRSLDRRIQDAIYAEYRPGQEIDKDPSLRYLAVQQHAIGVVAFRPYDEAAALIAAEYLVRSILYRRAAIANGDGDPLPWVPLTEATPQGVAE